MAKVHVQIENPLPGCEAETNMNRARRFVRSGRAVFTGPTSIRFVRALAQAGLGEQVRERQQRALTGGVYDRLAGNYYEHARRLPLLHPEKMLVKA